MIRRYNFQNIEDSCAAFELAGGFGLIRMLAQEGGDPPDPSSPVIPSIPCLVACGKKENLERFEEVLGVE